MSKFYTLGSYTDQALGGFIKNPTDDRSAVIRTLLESVGGKVVLFDILRKKAWYIAPLSSSILGSIVDTFLFFSIAFIYCAAFPWIA